MHRVVTHRNALVALHAAVELFGLAALFGQWVTLPATLIVLGRTTIAAVTLAIVAYARREPLHAVDRRLLANGAVLALHWVSFFAAVKLASVAIALLGYAMFPVFVLVLSLGPATRVTRRDCATAVLATLGLVAIVPALSWSSEATRGLALGVVSGFTFAWLAVRNRTFVATRPATAIALWQNVGAALCLVPVAFFAAPSTRSPSLADLALLVVLGVVCTGVAHTLFIASMRRLSAHTASAVASLEPVYGIALAAWLLHQIPDVRTIAGGALIVAAALAASQRSLGEARAVSVASGEARIGQ
jgi:drug/metabolite transporter (DMT)-like permease